MQIILDNIYTMAYNHKCQGDKRKPNEDSNNNRNQAKSPKKKEKPHAEKIHAEQIQ